MPYVRAVPSGNLLDRDACLKPPALGFEHRFRVESPEDVEQRGDEASPPGLMAGPEPGSVVAMKVLVEQDQVAPVRIVLEDRSGPVNRPLPVCIAEERARRSGVSVPFATSNSVMLLPRPGRALDGELVTVEAVQVQQRPDDQHVHRHPHRPTPV